MQSEIQEVDEAGDWAAYYSAYGKLYQRLLAQRWAMGRVSLAGHIHHTAIPDASGQVVGGISWAAYSQPSAETLAAFLTVFAELLQSEPTRIVSNRYLFFTLRTPPIAQARAESALGSSKNAMCFSLLSFEEQLEAQPWTGPIRCAYALLGSQCEPLRAFFSDQILRAGRPEPGEVNRLLSVLAHGLQVELRDGNLNLGDSILVRSSVLLSATLLRLPLETILESLGAGSAVAAIVARQRAHLSGWDTDLLSQLTTAIHFAPKEFETYRVLPGDILGRIVRERYGVPFEKLWPIISAVNPNIRDPNHIVAGQDIALPILK